jgi:hypothetical protein
MPATPGSLPSLPDLLDLPVSVAAEAIAIAHQLLVELVDLLGALRLAQRVAVQGLPLGDLGVVDASRLCDRRLLLVGERAGDDASPSRRVDDAEEVAGLYAVSDLEGKYSLSIYSLSIGPRTYGAGARGGDAAAVYGTVSPERAREVCGASAQPPRTCADVGETPDRRVRA